MNGSTSFEDRLLAVLETEITQRTAEHGAVERPRSIRRARIGALVGAGALATAAAVGTPVLLGQDAGSTAWAVQTHADGSVEVKIRELKDPAGLERRLAEAGIPAYINFVPAGMVCAQQTIRSDFSPSQKGLQSTEHSFIVHPGRLGPDERLALTGYALDADGTHGATHINVVPLNEERCKIVPMTYPSENASPTVPPGQ